MGSSRRRHTLTSWCLRGFRRRNRASTAARCGMALVVFIYTCQAAAQLGTAPPRTGGDCAKCHLEWADGFKEPAGILLMDAPDKAVVADADTCLGCHDGSVADSRRQVWLEHGHKTGVLPPPGMTVPQSLPLDKGKVVCRTCHTAHVAGFGESLRDAVFLRMKNDQDQLCRACHTDKTKGPATGSHPLAQMKTPMAAALAAAGAHAGPNNDLVLCQSCHTAHGAKQDHLLIMATNASELCISCHPTVRPAMWDTNPAHPHPTNPQIKNAAQLQAIKDMGTHAGSGDRLVCLACHKMHDGHAGKAMLPDTLKDGRFCIRCHEEKKPMLGTAHDLRKSAPASVNARSESLDVSGVCGACHTFHAYTRTPKPEPADPQGLCVTCHSEKDVAAKHPGKLFHPATLPGDKIPRDILLTLQDSTSAPKAKSLACLSCHDPHDTRHPHFLRVPAEQVCSTCHSDLAKSLAKPHDFTGRNDLKNAAGAAPADSGKCGFCHSVHEARGPAMLAATDRPIGKMDDVCTQCHQPKGLADKHPLARFNHPSGPDVKFTAARPAGRAPLYNASFRPDPAGSIACSSCHNVHIGEKASKALLRAATASDLCADCHRTEARMARGVHDPSTCKQPFPAEMMKRNDLCLTCHRAHSNQLDKQLWTVTPTSGQAGSDGACIACHADQAWSAKATADRIGLTLHPQAIAADGKVAKVDHGLPLAKPVAGSGEKAGAIACKTCHDPHGAPATAALLRIPAGQPPATLCGKCHAEAGHIETSLHNHKSLEQQISQPHACAPCHRVHATPGMPRARLWAARDWPEGAGESERLCLGCHSAEGGAAVPAVASHPKTTMKDIKKATTRPAAMLDHLGRINQITCSTCHATHGLDPALPAATGKPVRDRVVIAGLETLLRPRVDRELCAACHGIEGIRMYLYYHDPKKRLEAQPLNQRQ